MHARLAGCSCRCLQRQNSFFLALPPATAAATTQKVHDETSSPTRQTRALPGAFAARRTSGLGLRQVRQTIFFAIARHPKFEIWVRHFRRSTNRATMQRLRFGFAGLRFKTTTAGRYFTAVMGIVDDRGAA